VAQILIYPVTDYCFDTTSYQEHGSGYILTTELMQNFWDLYLSKPSDGDNPLASPLRANDLSGLPRALVLTAECDVLRDEGEAYGERLRAAGVETTVHRYNNMMHGFIQFGSMIPEAHTAISEIAAELKAAFNHNQ
jgi:acetyl esterase